MLRDAVVSIVDLGEEGEVKLSYQAVVHVHHSVGRVFVGSTLSFLRYPGNPISIILHWRLSLYVHLIVDIDINLCIICHMWFLVVLHMVRTRVSLLIIILVPVVVISTPLLMELRGEVCLASLTQ